MVAYARANPGKLSYSSGLPGVSPQLSVEMLKLLAKIDIVNVPYKIASQGLTDTIGGQVPLNTSNLPASVQPVQSGRLRALAVTSAQRTPQMPNVPTVQESGFPGYEVQSWYGLVRALGHARAGAGQTARRHHHRAAHAGDGAAAHRTGHRCSGEQP